MEPVGLAVGIAGLAGLFSVCLDVIDKVDSYKDYGIDSRSITAQFEADKHLFKIWARDVGFEKGNLNNRHHDRLDSPDTRAIIEKLLASINEIFGKSESSVSNLTTQNQSKIQRDNAIVPKKDRIGWTLRGKQRFIAQVQQFGALVQKLYSLVPPDSLRDGVNANTGPERADRGSLNGEWFANSQRILIEMQKRIEIDGLDECVRPTETFKFNHDDSVYGVLKTIGQATAYSNTRILIVSRPDADIRSGFYSISETDPDVKLYEYKISPDDVQSDALQFSRSVVDRKLAKKDEKVRDGLAHRIANRCEGMFLWVKVLENQLRGGKNRKQLEDIVDHTPTELNRLITRRK
ncbi:hypothetical protein DL770_005683 [Monosporascus sp. CRB-9-2]|nr:hypothetical protein DL770_005683 [Monosporascus sp. CRB-9-2]